MSDVAGPGWGKSLEALAPAARRGLLALAPHDHLLLAYLGYLALRLAMTPPTTERAQLLLVVLGTLAAYVGVLALGHAAGEPEGWRRTMLRLAPVGGLLLPYTVLRRIIPVANPALMDSRIHRLDEALLGFEPAVAWERWTTTGVVEWLSFWYMSYWVLVLAFVLAAVSTSEAARGSRFVVAFVFSMLAGHVLYIAVPGFGPLVGIRDHFAGPLPGGPLYALMHRVAATGAQRDIFPSLHTAHMLLLVLFCRAEGRESRAHRLLRWPLAFAAANVILATIFLRWHYVADVLAGAALAVASVEAGRRFTAWYAERRAEAGAAAPLW